MHTHALHSAGHATRREKKEGKAKRDMEENHRKREEKSGFWVMDRGSKSSPGQKHLDGTCSWPYSPLGEKELSQVSQAPDTCITHQDINSSVKTRRHSVIARCAEEDSVKYSLPSIVIKHIQNRLRRLRRSLFLLTNMAAPLKELNTHNMGIKKTKISYENG